MNKIAKYLNQHLTGNVFDREEILRKYSTDRSLLKILPQMVVLPENTNDVRRVVRFVDQLSTKGVQLNLYTRGSGLDATGADLGNGIVLSTEKLNKIQEIDEHARLVRVQSGCTLGELNSALSLVGLTVPVKANPRETIGGLISNFKSDDYGGKYNGIYYFVDCIEAVVSNGDVIQTGRLSKRATDRKRGLTNFEGAIYRDLAGLIETQFDLVSDIRRRNTIDSAGYQMITQVFREKGRTFDLMPIFYAAQGTLGIITEVILRCEVLPAHRKRFAVAFSDTSELTQFAQKAQSFEPLEMNLYDARIFTAAAETGKDPALFNKKFENGYILLLTFDNSARKNKSKIAKLIKTLPESAAAVVETEENASDFARVENAMKSYLNDDVKGERMPIIDDFYVSAAKLPEFLESLRESEEVYDTALPISGSISTGNYSIRPEINLTSVAGRQFAMKFLREFGSMLSVYEGSLTGGSAEGRTKAIVTNQNLSDAEYELYNRVKTIFDPHGIFAPDIKLGAEVKSVVKALRTFTLDNIA